MLDDFQVNPSSFLARQLYSTTLSTKGRIVIGGIVTTIARFWVLSPTLMIDVSGPSNLIKLLLKL